MGAGEEQPGTGVRGDQRASKPPVAEERADPGVGGVVAASPPEEGRAGDHRGPHPGAGTHLGLSFQDYRAIDALNCSAIKNVEIGGVRYAIADLNGEVKKDSEAMRLGTMVHTAVLEPEKWDEQYGVVTLGGRTKEGKKQKKQIEDRGATVIKQEHHDKAWKMAEAVTAHPLSAAFLSRAPQEHREMTVVVQDGSVWRKARLDLFLATGGVLADLKTAADISERGFSLAIYKYGYDMQAAYYLDCAKLAGIEAREFWFILVDKGATPEVRVTRMSDRAIEMGRQRYQQCERQLNAALDLLGETGEETWAYPAAFAGETDADMPEWAYKEICERWS